jgi:hypothetical protein
LKELTKECIRTLKRANFIYREGMTHHHGSYKPLMGYALPVSAFTEAQLQEIQGHATEVTLNALGYSSTFPNALTYTPPESGGIGLPNFYFLQGVLQVIHIIKNVRQLLTVGKYIMIILSWCQQESGASTSILADTKDLPHLTGPWVISVRKFLNECNAQLTIKDIYEVNMRRQNDTAIMDEAMREYKSDHLTKKEVKMINLCRIFLKAKTVADIATADGKHIQPSVLRGDSHTTSTSNRLWPCQTNPGKKSWKAWDALMKLIAPASKLRKPLGSWTNMMNRSWPVMYDNTSNTVRKQGGNTTEWFYCKPGRQNMTVTSPCNQLPQNPLLVPAEWVNGHVTTVPHDKQHLQPQEPTTFTEWITDESENDLLQHIPLIDEANLQTALEEWKILYLAHNASAKNNEGNFGWIISTENETLARGGGVARGKLVTPFRAEAYGRLASLTFIKRWMQLKKIKPHANATIESISDSKALIGALCDFQSQCKMKQLYTPNDADALRDFQSQREMKQLYTPNNADVIISIAAISDSMPVKLTTHHVFAHANSKCKPEEMSLHEFLNVKADEIVRKWLEKQQKAGKQ